MGDFDKASTEASRAGKLEQALSDIAVLAEDGKLELYAVGNIIADALPE
jgi:hypothetical protein